MLGLLSSAYDDVEPEDADSHGQDTDPASIDAAISTMKDRMVADLLEHGRSTRQNVYPLEGTAGIVGNAHTGKYVVKVTFVPLEGHPDVTRIAIAMLRKDYCIQGMQGYKPDSRTDFMKQTRSSLEDRLRELAPQVTAYMNPNKTKREAHPPNMEKKLVEIRATLAVVEEVERNVASAKRSHHRRPFRYEFFYAFGDIFEEEAYFPIPPDRSPSSGILEVSQEEVVAHDMAARKDTSLSLFKVFGCRHDHPEPQIHLLDPEEQTFMVYCAESVPRLHGCSRFEGAINRSLRLRNCGSLYSHQANLSYRVQGSQSTFEWTGIPYKLHASLLPCRLEQSTTAQEAGVAAMERVALEHGIASRMKGSVRNPAVYAKGEADIVALFHHYASFEDGDLDLDQRYGLFQTINYANIALLPGTQRTEMLTSCIQAVVQAYYDEWRALLDKRVRRLRRTRNHDNRLRGRETRVEPTGLPEHTTMPGSASEVIEIRTQLPDVHTAMTAVDATGPRIRTKLGKHLKEGAVCWNLRYLNVMSILTNVPNVPPYSMFYSSCENDVPGQGNGYRRGPEHVGTEYITTTVVFPP
jgi:hypothetical protein